MSFKLHHIHLLCSDLDQTEQFFIEKLEAVTEDRRIIGGVPGVILDLGGTKIYLRGAKPEEVISGDGASACYGYHHLGLEVDDMDAVQRRLRSMGLEFSAPPKKTPSGCLAFLRGPDNILFELFQPQA